MAEDKQKATIRGVSPPRTTFSTVMNSVGNWTMVGTLPFVVSESVAHLQGKTLSPGFVKTNLALLAAGSVIGAVFGFQEARGLDSYREALVKDLDDLHAKVDGQSPAKA